MCVGARPATAAIHSWRNAIDPDRGRCACHPSNICQQRPDSLPHVCCSVCAAAPKAWYVCVCVSVSSSRHRLRCDNRWTHSPLRSAIHSPAVGSACASVCASGLTQQSDDLSILQRLTSSRTKLSSLLCNRISGLAALYWVSGTGSCAPDR